LTNLRAIDMKMEDANLRDCPSAPIIVGLGELIWDILPGGKQLGGAPTNFAYFSHLLGNESAVASRIGDDALGREALRRLSSLGISTQYLQVDPEHSTGTVRVTLDERGEATFAVNENSAWDHLEWTAGYEELALKADVVCFGTLGQRTESARRTIIHFLEMMRPDALRVFDVNLRHSFFDAAMLERSLRLASIVKLNQAELHTLGRMLEFDPNTEKGLALQLLNLFDLKLVAITRGEKGSLLVTKDELSDQHGISVPVRDTIGAGDAFTASLVHYYLRGAPLANVSEAANRVGAWVVTRAGATPTLSPQSLAQILGKLE
jgi:fructokinase